MRWKRTQIFELVLFLLICTQNSLCIGQTSSSEMKQEIKALFADGSSSNEILIRCYINNLINDFSTRYQISDTAAYDSIVKQVSIYYNPSESNLTDTLKKIIDRSKIRFKNYNIIFGDATRDVYIRNGNVQIDPIKFGSIYKSANSSIFDSLSRAMDNYATAYIAHEFKSLTDNSEITKIAGGDEWAINKFFDNMSSSIVDNYEKEKEKKINSFDEKVKRINEEFEGRRSKLDSLVERATEFETSTAFSIIVLRDSIENNIDNFGDDYLAMRLDSISKTSLEYYNQIVSGDAGALDNFLSSAEQNAEQKFVDLSKRQVDNLLKVQNIYRDRLLNKKNKIEDFIDRPEVFANKTTEKIQSEYRKITNVLPHISSTMLQLNQSLQNTQEDLQVKLRGFYMKFVSDPMTKAQAVLFLASLIIDTKDAERGLQDVRNSLAPKVTDLEREFENSKEKLINTKNNLVSTVNDYFNTANLVVGSFQALGIGNYSTINKIGKGIQTAQTIVNTISAISSGNLLGAVGSIGGALGLGGQDPAVERHKQIMESLDRIDNKLDILNEKIDFIIQNQEKLYKIQQITYDNLINLKDTILIEFDKLNARLDKMDTKLNYLIAKDFITQYKKGTDACDELNLSSDNTNNILDYDTLEFTFEGIPDFNPKDIEKFFTDHSFYSNGDINLLYLASVYNDVAGTADPNLRQKKEFIESLDTFYGMLYNKVSTSAVPLFSSTINHSYLISLQNPLYNFQELNYKLTQTSINLSKFNSDIDSNEISNLISTGACERTADLILRYHPIISTTDKHAEVIPLNRNYFKRIEPRIKLSTIKYLSNALEVINAAIMEQNLLSGDILLETLRQEYTSFIIAPTPTKTDSVIFIANNSLLNNLNAEILCYNFLRYYISKEFDQSKNGPKPFTFIGYNAAFNSMDSIAMNNLMKSFFPFKLSYLDSAKFKLVPGVSKGIGWNCIIQGSYHSMPLPSEFGSADGFKLSYTTELPTLLDLRNKLINAIEGYEIANQPSKEAKVALNYIYLRELNPAVSSSK